MWCHHLTMQPDAAEKVKQIVRDLMPQLDSIGFHINSLGGPSAAGRLAISYDESTDVPAALIDAIARVTRADVDFVHAHTLSIADTNFDHLERHKPWRAKRSIEQLLSERAR
jgi:hypothetical protein